MNWYLIGNLLLLASIPPANLFVIFYGLRSPWRQLVAGRSLMYVFLAVSAVLDQIALTISTNSLTTASSPGYWGRDGVRIILYGSIAVTFWRMLWTLLHIQNRREVGEFPPFDIEQSTLTKVFSAYKPKRDRTK